MGKDLGRESGESLTFSRTYKSDRITYGMLEYSDERDAETAMRELDNRRLEGSRDKLRTHWGDLAADGKLGSYNGFGQYDGNGDRNRNVRRSRSRSNRKRSLSRRRSPPPRRGGGDEKIMTLFVKDLPDDARDNEISEDIDRSARVLRCMVTRRNGVCAFVRFGSVEDAEHAMDELNDGKCKVG